MPPSWGADRIGASLGSHRPTVSLNFRAWWRRKVRSLAVLFSAANWDRSPASHFWFQNFEDLAVGHFYRRAHDILASCKAYMEGVQVGCLVKGGVQDVDEDGGKNSDKFKADLIGYVKLLVKEFEKLGVKDCQKFIMSSTPVGADSSETVSFETDGSKTDSFETDYSETDSFETNSTETVCTTGSRK
ncbi:unnamed protein product [Trifolium pratense]|uniref:Uncharacterized protein n=1 Tax=Trifolium pratense TaxID=57577 RepID=A0ACB0KRK8_TRIPR|nr:unnamed protein product [Trifolium pratense]